MIKEEEIKEDGEVKVKEVIIVEEVKNENND
jgi:hypothetical protein